MPLTASPRESAFLEKIQDLICVHCVSASHFVTPQDPSCVATNQIRRVFADHESQHHPGFQTLLYVSSGGILKNITRLIYTQTVSVVVPTSLSVQ